MPAYMYAQAVDAVESRIAEASLQIREQVGKHAERRVAEAMAEVCKPWHST